MKQATITLLLSKDHSVIKTEVTPIEAMLLCAEHHKNAGGCPVEVHKETVKDTPGVLKTVMKKVSKGKQVIDGKPTEIFEEVEEQEQSPRSNNEELARLRGKYSPKKVAAIAAAGDLPSTFEEALKLGVGIVIPTGGAISETKL